MNSTAPVRDFYRGPVRNFTLFIECSSIIWFAATVLEAYFLFTLSKRISSSREPSRRIKAFVASLCILQVLHTVSANISHYTLPPDLTFDAHTAAPWAMKLTFLTTAITTALCLAYINRIVWQVVPPRRGSFYYHVVCIVVPLVVIVVASLAGQEIVRGTIETYFVLMGAFAFLWILLGSSIQLDLMKFASKPFSPETHRIFKTLSYVILLFSMTPFIVSIPTYLNDTPHIFWAYAQLTTYEVFGNAYPAILIGLMRMPGFGNWKQDDYMKLLAV